MSVPARFLSVSLALLLALSSLFPCYTLAYADEGAEVIRSVERVTAEARR